MTAGLLILNSVYLAVTTGTGAFYVAQLVLHPVLGIAAAAAFAAWWWRRRDDGATRWGGALLGLAALAGLAALGLPGGRTASLLEAGHVLLAVVGLAVLLVARHPARLARRGGAPAPGRGGAWYPAAALLVLAGGAGLLGVVAERPEPAPRAFVNPPAPRTLAEEALGGADGPFYPSAVHADPADLAVLPPASACGGDGCHGDLVAEWESSPHRWSGEENPWYRASLDAFREARGPAAATWCAGCHDPSSLSRRGPPESPPAAAATGPTGVSCASCHGIRRAVSTIGQGHYELALAPLARLAGGPPWQRRLHRWAARVDPDSHARAWSSPALTGNLASETCATCHKSHLDGPLNGHRWVQDMNDYDQWQASHVSGYGGRSFYRPEPRGCTDCHMPERPDGRRSHRFAGASTTAAQLSGDPEQMRAVEEMLTSGAVTVDVLAAVVDGRTLIPIDGATLPAGTSVRVDVVVATPGMGHFFPGGKIDASDAWLELRAEDGSGEPIFWSGRLREDGSVEPSAHRFRLRLIDADGRPVEHRDVWRARAEVYRSWVLPLAADVVRYRLELPPDLEGPVRLTARLHYRDRNPEFHRWAARQLGEADLPELPPVIVVAQDAATFDVAPPGSEAAPGAVRKEDWRRFNDYGIGLLLQGDVKGSRSAFIWVTGLDPSYVDGFLNRTWISSIEGDLDAMEATLVLAEDLDPDLARTLFFRGRFEQQRGDVEAAEGYYRRAAELYPWDRVIRVFLVQTLAAQGDHGGVLEQTDHLLAIDPEYSLAHYQAMLAHRALGDAEAAERHQQLYERFRADEEARALTGPYLETHPDDNRERQAIHEHPSGPLPGSPVAGAGEAE